MKHAMIIFLILTSSLLDAQTKNSPVTGTKIYFGTEADIFPFATGGYYCSIIAGKNNLQGRVVLAKSNQPQFILPDGFDKNTMHVIAFIIDYFPNSETNATGLWIGGGFEVWQNSARNKTERVTGEFTNYVVTAGAGYTYFFNNYLYINPWAAVHGITGGPKSVSIGNRHYTVPDVLPELSLKIGVRF